MRQESHLHGMKTGNPEGLSKLMYALLLSGLAMQMILAIPRLRLMPDSTYLSSLGDACGQSALRCVAWGKVIRRPAVYVWRSTRRNPAGHRTRKMHRPLSVELENRASAGYIRKEKGYMKNVMQENRPRIS